jgi:1,4-dihydroxy-2-naphthoate octaprenyltransferase
VIAVVGTYYVQAATTLTTVGPLPLGIPDGTLTVAALVASLPAAGLSTAILIANNVRDKEEDAAAGKRTLAVMFGYTFSRIEWLAMVGMAYVVPVLFALDSAFGLTALAPLVTLPLAVRVGATVMERTDGAALNPALERTGQLLAAHSALFAVGLALT